jgi:hypothetical protein
MGVSMCVPLWGEDAHEMGVSMRVPLWGEDAHEMGVSFEMKRCVPL